MMYKAQMAMARMCNYETMNQALMGIRGNSALQCRFTGSILKAANPI